MHLQNAWHKTVLNNMILRINFAQIVRFMLIIFSKFDNLSLNFPYFLSRGPFPKMLDKALGAHNVFKLLFSLGKTVLIQSQMIRINTVFHLHDEYM